MKLSIKTAAAQARKYTHGCGSHVDAMTVLFAGYRQAFPKSDGTFVTLDALWAWVDGYLEMEEASYDDTTPLG